MVDVPLIPISLATDLLSSLDKLQNQINNSKSRPNKPASRDQDPSPRDVLANCVEGPPLSWRQTNVLMDVLPGFRDVAIGSFNPENQAPMCDFLGDEDGNRVIGFFTSGPKKALR